MQTPSKANILSAILLDMPWKQVMGDLWIAGKNMLSKLGDQGLYEVLEYDTTLELKDGKGERAVFRKCQKVRYLQDNVIAYQDQAWGDGKILVNSAAVLVSLLTATALATRRSRATSPGKCG